MKQFWVLFRCFFLLLQPIQTQSYWHNALLIMFTASKIKSISNVLQTLRKYQFVSFISKFRQQQQQQHHQCRQKWMTCEHSNNLMLWNQRIICGYGVLNNTNRKIWTTCIDGWWCLHIISIYSSSSVWLNNRAHSQFVLTLVIVFLFFLFCSLCQYDNAQQTSTTFITR